MNERMKMIKEEEEAERGHPGVSPYTPDRSVGDMGIRSSIYVDCVCACVCLCLCPP